MKKLLFIFSLIIFIGIGIAVEKGFFGGRNIQKHEPLAPATQASKKEQVPKDEQAPKNEQASGKIYNWTDKNGVEHITTTPPPKDVKIKHETTFKKALPESEEKNNGKQAEKDNLSLVLGRLQKGEQPEKAMRTESQKKAESDNTEQDVLGRIVETWKMFKSMVTSSK